MPELMGGAGGTYTNHYRVQYIFSSFEGQGGENEGEVRAKLEATRLGFSNWNLKLPAPSCSGDVLVPARSLASGSRMSGWVESAAFISCSKCFLERQRKEETEAV